MLDETRRYAKSAGELQELARIFRIISLTKIGVEQYAGGDRSAAMKQEVAWKISAEKRQVFVLMRRGEGVPGSCERSGARGDPS